MGWLSRRRKAEPDQEPTAPAVPADAAGDSADIDIAPEEFDSDAGRPWTGRALLLPARPTPANASELARIAAEAAQTVAGIELDFSPASLHQVDGILDGFRDAGSDIMAESIFIFGCYLGEVMVRHAGYVWVDTPADLAKHLGVLTVYHPGTQSHANPINKAFKRVDYGDPDNLPYFYHVFTSEDPLS